MLVSLALMWALLPSAVWADAPEQPATQPALLFANDLRGPFPTGTFETVWTNAALQDPSTRTVQPRKLLIQIWYPTAREDASARAPYAISPGLYGPKHWVHQLPPLQTRSTLNAPVMAQEPAWPVLLYNHGNRSTHFGASFQTEFLASHGYVVVSIGHPGANEIQRFPDGSAFTNDGFYWMGVANPQANLAPREEFEQILSRSDLSLFVQDIRFVIDELTRRNADASSPLHQRLNLSRIGSLGWSLGGFSSLQASLSEPRLQAVANLDGWPHGLLGPDGAIKHGIKKPVLLMFSERNGGIAALSQAQHHAASPDQAAEIELQLFVQMQYWEMLRRSSASWYHITLARTHHGHFSDGTLFETAKPHDLPAHTAHALINGYVLEFFDRHLKNSSGPSPLLSGSVQPENVRLLKKH